MSATPTCVLCDRPRYALGFCNAHYRRYRRHSDPHGGRASPSVVPAVTICTVAGCGKLSRSSPGFCVAHYQRWRLYGNPLAGKTPNGSTRRFVEMALACDSDDCLNWPYEKDADGYGKLRWQGRRAVASRIVCELAHGAPPSPRREAAHSCGRGHRGCVNPRHLRWATRRENAADMHLHNTLRFGSRHHLAKLEEADIRIIRELTGSVTQKELAENYGVDITTISDIQRGKSWRYPELLIW